jgi:hypothetical protein
MPSRLIPLLLAVLVLAACGSDEEPEGAQPPASVSSTAATTTAELPREWTECTNDAEGYALAYPKGWHTDALAPDQECAYFDPEPFEIVEGSEFPATALEAHWLGEDDRPFAAVVEDLTDPMFERTIAREPFAEGKLRGQRLETEATGEGLLAGGTRTYAYLLDVEGRAFVVKTTESTSIGFEEAKGIVDEAVGTLRFFAVDEPGGEELPEPVAETRRAIAAAAAARDYDALRALIPKAGFTYTYGSPVAGGPTAYWRQLEGVEDPSPLAALAAILEMPPTREGEAYVWPFAYDRNPAELTRREREILAPVASEQQIDQWAGFGHYLGWRAGIRSDGAWLFFVAGD